MDIRREVLAVLLFLALLLGFVVLARSADGADQIVNGASVDGVPVVTPVYGSTYALVFVIPPGASAWSAVICDQYGYDQLPYWSVEVVGQAAPELGINVEPIQSDFVKGKLAPVQSSTSPRWRWTEKDNADNAKAFACYRLTAKTRPDVGGRDLRILLRRKSKIFNFGDANPGDRLGRSEKTRELQIFLRAAEPKDFSEWVDYIREKSTN